MTSQLNHLGRDLSFEVFNFIKLLVTQNEQQYIKLGFQIMKSFISVGDNVFEPDLIFELKK